MAMLHETTRKGTMSGMADMNGLDLPAGQPVALAPGGMHIMLMGLRHGLAAGDQLSLDLTFAHAPALHVRVPVQPLAAAGPPAVSR